MATVQMDETTSELGELGTVSDTWSRRELLTMRGYDQAVIEGHGNPAPEPETAAEPTCQQCGQPIPPARVGKGALTCSPACAEARRQTIKAESRRSARQAAASTEGPQVRSIQLGSPVPAGRNGDRLGSLFQVLMRAGATIVRVEVALGGETWAVQRIEQRRTPCP